MAKRSKKLTIERKLEEGRGIGVGKDYKPWITIQDFPSKGRVSRIKGIKTQRQHEFLSDLERNYFYYLDMADQVIDIREQFPLLPIEDTLIIAQELGIEHPRDPVTKEPIVMTTDFLVTVKNKKGELTDIARTTKYKEELLQERVVEKFEIERLYFKSRGIDWGIVTEEEIDKLFAHNLADIHAYNDLSAFSTFSMMQNFEIHEVIAAFIERCVMYEGSLRNLCSQFDKDMELEKGSGIAIFKYLLVTKIFSIDMRKAINFSEHIEVKINENKWMEGTEIG